MSASENVTVTWSGQCNRRGIVVAGADGGDRRRERGGKHLLQFLQQSRKMCCNGAQDDVEAAADCKNVGAEFPSHGKSLGTMGLSILVVGHEFVNVALPLFLGAMTLGNMFLDQI